MSLCHRDQPPNHGSAVLVGAVPCADGVAACSNPRMGPVPGRMSAALLAAALCAGPSIAAPVVGGLTRSNYVEVGDTIVEMLDTSALSAATLLLGLKEKTHTRLASFATVLPHTQTFSAPCSGGGSIDVSIADRDASGDVSVSDRFVTVFNACRVGGGVVSGSSTFSIASHRTDDAREITVLEFSFRQLGSAAMRWSGSARATLTSDRRTGAERYNVTYQNMKVTRGPQSTHWNFTLASQRPPLGDQTTQIDGSMTVDDAVLRLVQAEPFVIAPSGKPRSGRLVATDPDGDHLEVEAGRRRYQYRFFGRGNRGDVPDSSSQSKPHGGT